MKKITFLCIALMSLSMAHANVISGTCGDNLTWSYDTDKHSLVISGTGDMYDFYYDEKTPCPWKTIAASIVSVTLPNGLTRIGNYAFEGCESLTSIDIPNTVLSIGSQSFASCGLTSVVIPNSVTEIGESVFYATNYLENIVISNAITVIPFMAFYPCHCPQVTIPASVIEIEPYAFEYFEEIYLESSVPATIASNSFKSDVVLHVPCNSVSAYLAAPIWQFLNVSGNLDYDFKLGADEGGSARITKSVCEANTVVIEATANAGYHFTGWSDGNTDNPRAIVLTADKSVTAQFEPSTTYFHVSLSGFSYMEYNEGSSSGPNWSGEVLEGSYIRFECITDCGTFTGWSDGSEYTYRNIQITCDTTITANYTGIETYQVSITAGEHGFLSKEIVGKISSCANTFDVHAYADEGYHFVEWSDGVGSSYRWFGIYSDTTVYAIFAKGEEGGKLGETLYWSYEEDKKQITVTGTGAMEYIEYAENGYFGGGYFSGTKKLVIEEGAANIEHNVFKSLKHLQSADLAASIERIEESAFEDCRSLSQVTFAAGSSLTTIGDWAFYNCHELSKLELPENVTTIGKAAFFGCAYLSEVVLPASVQAIGDNAFAFCSMMQKLSVKAVVPPTIEAKTFEQVSLAMPVYVPGGSVSAYKADPYWGRMNIIGAETAVENTTVDATAIRKQMINGQLLILRDGKTYTVQGLEVK